MANHFHLVVETPAGNLSRFMQSLSTAYTVYFNRRHGRHGHLLDGRYKARLVEGDEYLLALSRYVHLNPVFTKAMVPCSLQQRIDCLRRYRWSSYPGYIGRHKQFDFVDSPPILSQMNCPKLDQAHRYRHYVESGFSETDKEFMDAITGSPLCIGSSSFRDRVAKKYEAQSCVRDSLVDVSFRNIVRPLGPDTVLEVLAEAFGVGIDEFCRRRRNSPLRGIAARLLCHIAGLSQREAAKVLQLGSGSGVSQHIRALKKRMSEDRTLSNLVIAVESKLSGLRGKDIS